MAKKTKKEIPYTNQDINIRIKEYLDKEGKGAAGKTSQEMKKKVKLIEKNGKFSIVERKKKGGMVIAPKSGSAHYTYKKNSKSIAKKYFKGSF